MPVCPKCGSQVADGVKFCGSCGSAIGPAPSNAAAPSSPPGSPGQASPGAQGGIASNVAAMLTYVPICLVGLVCAILFGFILEPQKKDRFVRFHAWQSLAVHAAFVVFWIVWWIFSLVVTAIVHAFAFILFPVSMLVSVGVLVVMIFLMVKAYGNESYKLPVVGDWAEKQAGT